MTLPATKSNAPQAQDVHVFICGVTLTLLPDGAIWWAERKTLIVSDLHFEKGSNYARSGQLLPPYDTSATLSIVENLIQGFTPECVISLGDSFHDSEAEKRLAPRDAARIKACTASTDWIWVEGNHDPDPPAHLGGRGSNCLELGPLTFRHEPTGQIGEIAGHLHPCARIVSRVRTLRRRCFITDGQRLILPAMGAFTGGLNVCDVAFEACFPHQRPLIFALAETQIVPIAPRRLIADTVRRKSGQWRIAASS